MLPFVLVIFRAFPLTAGKYMRHAGDMGRVRTGAGTKKHQVALAVSKRRQSELRGPLEATGPLSFELGPRPGVHPGPPGFHWPLFVFVNSIFNPVCCLFLSWPAHLGLVPSKNGGRGKIATPPAGTERAGLRWEIWTPSTENREEMKQVMALVLGVALVGASAATTSAQTGTGTGGGTGTKSTTTTTSPTTAPTTAPTTTKKTTTVDCPGNAEKSKGKATAQNPNCR